MHGIRRLSSIIQMGEREECVFPYGCPSADVVSMSSGKFNTSLFHAGVGPVLDLSVDYVLVLFHPVTTEYGDSEIQMKTILSALKDLNKQTVLIWPNIDAGADAPGIFDAECLYIIE